MNVSWKIYRLLAWKLSQQFLWDRKPKSKQRNKALLVVNTCFVLKYVLLADMTNAQTEQQCASMSDQNASQSNEDEAMQQSASPLPQVIL